MSKHHATLYFTSEKDIAVEDEGSANGTFIGAERIQSRTAVAIGSEIRFCHQDPITLKLSK
jgi:pSer/pThr/pTyr-binding forkhead associated (FHA) protein